MKFAYLIEPPFNYIDNDGRITGCDVELARIVLGELGHPDFELVGTEFGNLLPGLSAGHWTMTTGLFATDDRRQSALFSRPIWALPDGLLVAKSNPCKLTGYKSLADKSNTRLAVIRNQFQHLSTIGFGVEPDRILIFETYAEAASAVMQNEADAYASVARAHTGFLAQNPALELECVVVPDTEKPAQFGSFAFAITDRELQREVDQVLSSFLGTPAHRRMMKTFGFSDQEVDLVVPE